MSPLRQPRQSGTRGGAARRATDEEAAKTITLEGIDADCNSLTFIIETLPAYGVLTGFSGG